MSNFWKHITDQRKDLPSRIYVKTVNDRIYVNDHLPGREYFVRVYNCLIGKRQIPCNWIDPKCIKVLSVEHPDYLSIHLSELINLEYLRVDNIDCYYNLGCVLQLLHDKQLLKLEHIDVDPSYNAGKSVWKSSIDDNEKLVKFNDRQGESVILELMEVFDMMVHTSNPGVFSLIEFTLQKRKNPNVMKIDECLFDSSNLANRISIPEDIQNIENFCSIGHVFEFKIFQEIEKYDNVKLVFFIGRYDGFQTLPGFANDELDPNTKKKYQKYDKSRC